MCVKVVVVSCMLALSEHAAWAQNPPRFHFTLAPGPHAVGLKVVEQYDESRTYLPLNDELGKPTQGERARPLQTLVWYPAEKTSGKAMTIGDYVGLIATETSFGKPAATSDDWEKEALAPAARDAMRAVRDAPAAAGRFPVVIYAPSFGANSWENADLCEYLASQGYVVIASTALGANGREMTADLPGVNAEARDISFLIGFAQTLPDADVSEIAVGGFSWGGLANLFAAAKDNRIDALFALDGSMRYFPGLVKDSGFVQPESMSLPLLFFTEGEIPMEELDPTQMSKAETGPSVLNEWKHGDLITVRMLGMTHGEFSSMSQRHDSFWKNFARNQKADYGREDGIPGYAWVSNYTAHFLDAYLKHDAAAMAWLKKTPSENGVAKHFLSVDFREAKGVAPSLEAFRVEVGRRGFNHASEIFAEIKKENADFKLDEQVLEGWGDGLASDNHLEEAIAILSLNESLYPDSSDAFGHLGDAYKKAGRKQEAIGQYRKAIEKNPENDDAKKHLAELEKRNP
jgi:tetratricopeptide (TPR) repeat protein